MPESTSPQAPQPPPESGAPFNTGVVLRRLAHRLELDGGSRVFEFRVRGPSAGVLLARECGCRVTVADPSEQTLERVRAEADAAGVLRQLSLLQADGESLSFPSEAFDLAISAGRSPALASLATLLRPVLVPSRGRLVAVVAARVGVAVRDLAPWEKALGGALRTPQGELAELARHGFEPEWAEALSEAQLIELYGARPAPADEEAALVQSGPSGLSFVLVAGRRREPDERPPEARDRG